MPAGQGTPQYQPVGQYPPTGQYPAADPGAYPPNGQYPPAGQYPPMGGAYVPQPAGGDKQPNIVGYVSMGLAILGTILGCIKGIMALGWILLIAAFITSIVGLCLKNKVKWPAIVGLVVSIVGTIISFVVFATVVGGAVSDALDEQTASTSTSTPTEAGATPTTDADSGLSSGAGTGSTDPNDQTFAFGDAVEFEDGLDLTVSAPRQFTPDSYAAGNDQASNVEFTVTLHNATSENFDPSDFYMSVASNGTEGSEVFDESHSTTPTTTLLPGQDVTFVVGYSVANPASLTAEVDVDDQHEVMYTTN